MKYGIWMGVVKDSKKMGSAEPFDRTHLSIE